MTGNFNRFGGFDAPDGSSAGMQPKCARPSCVKQAGAMAEAANNSAALTVPVTCRGRRAEFQPALRLRQSCSSARAETVSPSAAIKGCGLMDFAA